MSSLARKIKRKANPKVKVPSSAKRHREHRHRDLPRSMGGPTAKFLQVSKGAEPIKKGEAELYFNRARAQDAMVTQLKDKARQAVVKLRKAAEGAKAAGADEMITGIEETLASFEQVKDHQGIHELIERVSDQIAAARTLIERSKHDDEVSG